MGSVGTQRDHEDELRARYLRTPTVHASGEYRLGYFLRQARDTHGDRFGYDLVPDSLSHAGQPVTIICPDHGPFTASLQDHVRDFWDGACPVCRRVRKGLTHPDGRAQFYGEWARELGLSETAMRARRNSGWTDAEILLTPLNGDKAAAVAAYQTLRHLPPEGRSREVRAALRHVMNGPLPEHQPSRQKRRRAEREAAS